MRIDVPEHDRKCLTLGGIYVRYLFMMTMRPINRPADQAANDPTPDRPESHDCCSDAAVEARTARQFATLTALTKIGMEVAGVVGRALPS
jgi:hypothetical protein